MNEATIGQQDRVLDNGISRKILGMRVDQTTYERSARLIVEKASQQRWGYVSIANVHMVMEALDDERYRRIINDSDLVTPDGVPLLWSLRLLGARNVERVYGPDLTPIVCAEAAREGAPVGFYGGSEEALAGMVANLKKNFPSLNIVFAESPPFRDLGPQEDRDAVERMIRSGARILFVGLGCPKQEKWMAEHKGKIPAVMLGVGAAFDFIGGTKKKAPPWLQRAGLEWLFRLADEPKRLWRRYLFNNPRFVYQFALQVLKMKDFDK